MRVALIGPVPPQLGGATPGGVATHQVHLAAGLAAAGIDAPLLATNTRVPAGGLPGAARRKRRSRCIAWARPAGARGQYLAGGRTAAHGAATRSQLAVRAPAGSRREILANLLWYRRFLAEVAARRDPRAAPARTVRRTRARCMRLEGWQMPLVVTAHSLFGEHSAATIETVMAPNLRAADRVIAVSPHIAEQAMQLGVEPPGGCG